MIDKDEAIRLLRKEVANKGEDYIYVSPIPKAMGDLEQTCVYAHDGRPSCLVGHVLVDAGVDAEVLESENFLDIGAVALPKHLPDVLDDEAAEVFSAAQSVQDQGNKWGSALSEAENKYRELGGTE